MTTADVSVRVAWSQDAAGIAAVQLRSWQQRYDEVAPGALAELGTDDALRVASWEQYLTRPPEARYRALVALERVRIVGFALTGPATDPDADPATDGELAEFTVEPGRTRQGHGSRLLQAAVDTLAADGFTRVVSWIDSTDDAARAFLESAGWAPDGASRELSDESGAGSVKQVRLHTAIG
ncbi:GNAT family N-acetyltransferase [Nocardioides humilatus]|uniref:GNAT family N-acetyltransferase n=1 Tax=Nocardioides humilatus TaxID=2607660 RepID=A0A5B1LDZ4_9ACTN|nr:GNAT family N-acetyltransferase [Nocardioides humilatus]KAA1418000.1 GNAT family N-acetyltransferase [Nocardioides humilatus]